MRSCYQTDTQNYKFSRHIYTVLQYTTFQTQFYKMVAYIPLAQNRYISFMLISHNNYLHMIKTSEPYTVWCGCCSQAKQTCVWLLC
jgi:hypothetical protein